MSELPKATNSLALGSLIVGIIGLLMVCCGGMLGLSWFGIPMGVIAIVLGFVGLSQIKTSGEAGEGLAYGGIATGALTLIMFFVVFFGVVALIIGANLAQM